MFSLFKYFVWLLLNITWSYRHSTYRKYFQIVKTYYSQKNFELKKLKFCCISIYKTSFERQNFSSNYIIHLTKKLLETFSNQSVLAHLMFAEENPQVRLRTCESNMLTEIETIVHNHHSSGAGDSEEPVTTLTRRKGIRRKAQTNINETYKTLKLNASRKGKMVKNGKKKKKPTVSPNTS